MSKTRITIKKAEKILKNITKTSIMVIGDIMLDEYLWGDVTRISPEAPVPVVNVSDSTLKLGGAANVAYNIQELGATPILVSVIGNDGNGSRLKSLLFENCIEADSLIESKSRPSTHKTRIIARNQQVVRADRESNEPLNEDEYMGIKKMIREKIHSCKGCIISDYGKGILTKKLVKFIIQECNKAGIFVSIDPKIRDIKDYSGASLMTPNLKEAHELLGLPVKSRTDDEIKEIGWNLLEKAQAENLLVTLGSQGMALFQSNKASFQHLETVAQKVFDVTGAGDTVISVFTSAVAAGATLKDAMILSNHAAGLIVGELGTAAVTPESLLSTCSQ